MKKDNNTTVNGEDIESKIHKIVRCVYRDINEREMEDRAIPIKENINIAWGTFDEISGWYVSTSKEIMDNTLNEVVKQQINENFCNFP